MTVKIVHYLNQFFGQIGGEDKADIPPESRNGKVGPGMAFEKAFSDNAKIVGTVICGDTYFNENPESALKEVLDLIKKFEPDVVVAGPAFNAGRYGMACGAVCQGIAKELGIPAVTGMYPENPGVDTYKKDVYIIETGDSAAGMAKAVPAIAKLALKLGSQEEVGTPEEEGYIPRGIRKNFFKDTRGSQRGVDLLIKKLKGETFETEYPMPDFDRVTPNPPIEDMANAKVALVTSGGIVPKNNPDKIEASSASKYGKYELADIENLTSETFETAHGGYDPTYANEDPDRVLPVDVLRELEKENVIGSFHEYYYSTVGNGTSVANAKRFSEEFAKELVNDGVQAVILTST